MNENRGFYQEYLQLLTAQGPRVFKEASTLPTSSTFKEASSLPLSGVFKEDNPSACRRLRDF